MRGNERQNAQTIARREEVGHAEVQEMMELLDDGATLNPNSPSWGLSAPQPFADSTLDC